MRPWRRITSVSYTHLSYDFSGKFPKAGTYYFKVRAMDSRNNAGEWQESPYIEITEEDLTRVNGQWLRDCLLYTSRCV